MLPAEQIGRYSDAPPTNAQFESALQKARKQPGAAHVDEMLLGLKMVTPRGALCRPARGYAGDNTRTGVAS